MCVCVYVCVCVCMCEYKCVHVREHVKKCVCVCMRGMCMRADAHRGSHIGLLHKLHFFSELLGEQSLHSLGVFPVPSATAELDLDLLSRHG
jgi:hypothetical protein